MAIDGVKIIDSDDGHDIYNAIVERYKDGVSIDTIISEILNEEQTFVLTSFIQRFIGLLWPIRCGR